MEKKILDVVIGGVINGKGEILLLKRRKDPYANYWGLPGGKINFGESPEEAIEREIKEETDIDAKLVGLKGLVNEIIYEEKKNEELMHFIIWVCELKPSHFKARESVEGKLRWLSLKTLAKFKRVIIPSDFLMIRKLFAKKTRAIPFYKVKMIATKIGYTIEETDL